MTASGLSFFEHLADFERRSVEHDSSRSSQDDAETTWNGLVFRLGDDKLTMGVAEIEEILPLPAITPIPGAVDWLLGMANVRGNLVTIVDLGWFLFGSRTPHTARTRLILTRLQGKFTGLVVDEVYGQRYFNLNDVQPNAKEGALTDFVEVVMCQGDEQWGRFRFDVLAAKNEFLDGSARRMERAAADATISAF